MFTYDASLMTPQGAILMNPGKALRKGEQELHRAFYRAQGITVHAFDLPVYRGAAACLHLMSLVSLLDHRTALIHETLLPVGLYQLMQTLGYRLITIPVDEYEASGTLCGNILALSPGECVMVDGFPKTRAALESMGIGIQVFQGDALCIGCEGGPTCLSRPILRN